MSAPFKSLAPGLSRSVEFDYFAPLVSVTPPSISFLCASEFGVATLCGLSEYTTPSVPPKKYRKQTPSGQSLDCDVLTGAGTCETGNGYASTKYIYTGSYDYDPVTCAIINTQNQEYWQNIAGQVCDVSMVHAVDTPMPVNFTPNDHGYPAQFNTVTTPTQISVTGNGVCTAQGGAHYSKVSGTVLKTLSNEDTEIDAIARASTTPGSSCTAAIEPRGAADFTFNFVAVSYDLSCARLAPGGSYIATVELLTEDYGGGNPVVSTQDYPFTASGVTHLIADVIVCPSGSQVTVQNATIVSD